MLGPRVDDHLPTGVMCASDDLLCERLRDKALRVVGHHDDVARGDQVVEQRENGRLGVRVQWVDLLVIQAHDLLMLTDDPCFAKRWRSVGHRLKIDARLLSAPCQRGPGIVVSNEGDERGAAPEGGDVGRGVRRSSEDPPDVVDSDDGHWRFGRNPAAVA